MLAELLTILDDIDRAREHDELSGGFKSVAEAIEATAMEDRPSYTWCARFPSEQCGP